VPQFKNVNIRKSGGEITQVYLQTAFNESPGLLLLDEPTTHLDYERIVWLENNLHDFLGAVLIVSHDRAFLDHICTEIWEIEDASITVYKGNYSEYANQKTLERKQHQIAFEKYKKDKQKIEEAIRIKEEKEQRATKKQKNMSGKNTKKKRKKEEKEQKEKKKKKNMKAKNTKQKSAKPYYENKQKKLRKTASAFETKLEQMKEVEQPRKLPPIKMDVINEHAINNKIIIRGEEVFGKIDDNLLWHPFNFHVLSGEKIAVIGSNGSGKTTLLEKIIDEGQGISISPAVKIGYFSQHITILKDQKSILE